MCIYVDIVCVCVCVCVYVYKLSSDFLESPDSYKWGTNSSYIIDLL